MGTKEGATTRTNKVVTHDGPTHTSQLLLYPPPPLYRDPTVHECGSHITRVYSSDQYSPPTPRTPMRSVSGPYVARNNASSAAPVPELRRSLTFLGLLASTMARRITLSLCPMSVYSSSPSVDLASAAARRSHVRASKDRAIARARTAGSGFGGRANSRRTSSASASLTRWRGCARICLANRRYTAVATATYDDIHAGASRRAARDAAARARVDD